MRKLTRAGTEGEASKRAREEAREAELQKNRSEISALVAHPELDQDDEPRSALSPQDADQQRTAV